MPASPASPVTIRTRAASEPRGRPGTALILVLCAQLMVILDATIVNIALPSIETGLHFSATSLSWVLDAYSLTFGGLLLLGGRAGDILGRRRTFMAGITVFTLASLAGGLATTSALLVIARAVQGTGAAIASPAALSLIVSAFPEGRGRNRALGLYAAVSMAGASLGLVLGGIITQWSSWRWVFFVNVPAGVAVVLLAPAVLRETPRQPGRFDLAGGLTSVTGMASLVYAFIRAAAAGWTSGQTLAALGVAVAALTAFGLTETRAVQPVTPLRLFADGPRAASYAARLLLVAGMFGMFFFLTQFLQDVLGLSPLRAGVAFLPMTLLVFAVSRTSSRLLTRFPPTPLMIMGLVPVIVGMGWLSRITPTTGYAPGVVGPMLLLGAGLGLAFVPLTTSSLAGVRPQDAGAASSMVNVAQQVGGALGLAILVTVYSSAASAVRTGGAGISLLARQTSLVHGMSSAFTAATMFDVGALLVIVVAALAVRRRLRRVPRQGRGAAG